jgi:hypothetical protein
MSAYLSYWVVDYHPQWLSIIPSSWSLINYHPVWSNIIYDIRLSWMNIVLLGQKWADEGEYRTHQKNIMCCSWKSSVVNEYTVIFFGRNLFKMGESAQLNFAPKISGEILPIWENFPKFANFWLKHWTKFAQIEKNSPTNFGEKLNCAFASFRANKNYCVSPNIADNRL